MINCPSCGEENPPKFRLCGYCGAPLAPAPAPLPAREMRKTVTLIFSDLKDSTALGERLDSEALHEVKDRYFTAMAAEIKRHGGKIEKYIGDAIMAVFGLPRAHEDDALRAVRAADDMRKALVRVNADLQPRYGVTLANRTGVNTGEVVASDDPTADQKLATGDAVNVAARLEQAAPVNEIYLGESTYRLVRDAVEVETVEPLTLKGKAEKVAAYRLVSALGFDGYARRQDTPIVGRDDELAALHQAYDEVRGGRTVRMVTVVGDAGLGKSRLVREVTDQIAADAKVLRGRCLPYGDGITFWPLVGMVRGAAAIEDEDHPEAARAKLLAAVGDADVADRLAAAVGLSQAAFPLHELYWGARKFLEGFAAHGPVVALIDDIHWAEPAFLELLEHILDSSSGAPILILTTSRHDLLETHPNWGERAGSTCLVLRPLKPEAAAQVVANLLGSAGLPQDVVDRIVTAAEGNPLYVEQMLSMLIDSGALQQQGEGWVRSAAYVEITVPPTIQALLGARLDNLARADRAAVEPASVIGLEFERTALESIAPEAVRAGIGEHLNTLARKHFVDPKDPAHGIYRFHHHLVRETVYNGLLKRARANLHVAFVRWADAVNADRDRALEFQEILGYHLEQAHRYLGELGPLDDAGIAIGADAAQRLASAGSRAMARGDMHAAANLFGRAATVLPTGATERLELLPQLGEALMELGDFERATAVFAQAQTLAASASNERVQVSAELFGLVVRRYLGDAGDWITRALALGKEAVPMLERLGAHTELTTVWRVLAGAHSDAGRYGLAAEAANHYMANARRAGNERLMARAAGAVCNSMLLGPTPVSEATAQCEQLIAKGIRDRQLETLMMCTLAQLRAMNGEFDAARELIHRARAVLRELGQSVHGASTGIDLGTIELLAGDLAGAEREIRADLQELEKMGETYFLSTMVALLAQIVRDQGRDDEALELLKTAEEAAADDDYDANAKWRSIRAPILARAGDLEAADALARQALELALNSEEPILQANVFAELATVLQIANRSDEAGEAIRQAIDLYTFKGDRVSAQRSAEWSRRHLGQDNDH